MTREVEVLNVIRIMKRQQSLNVKFLWFTPAVFSAVKAVSDFLNRCKILNILRVLTFLIDFSALFNLSEIRWPVSLLTSLDLDVGFITIGKVNFQV